MLPPSLRAREWLSYHAAHARWCISCCTSCLLNPLVCHLCELHSEGIQRACTICDSCGRPATPVLSLTPVPVQQLHQWRSPSVSSTGARELHRTTARFSLPSFSTPPAPVACALQFRTHCDLMACRAGYNFRLRVKHASPGRWQGV